MIGEPLVIDHLAVFIEREQGAPFEVHSLFPIAAGGKTPLRLRPDVQRRPWRRRTAA